MNCIIGHEIEGFDYKFDIVKKFTFDICDYHLSVLIRKIRDVKIDSNNLYRIEMGIITLNMSEYEINYLIEKINTSLEINSTTFNYNIELKGDYSAF